MTVFKANGGVAVAPDGGVYALSQHEVEHCDAQRVCRRAAGRLEVLAGSQLEAIALAPNGDILIATATPTPRRKPSAESPETTAIALALVRCKDVFCEHPEVRDLGSVQGGFDDRYSSSWFRTLMVDTDRSGRPVVGFRHLGMVWIGQCGTAACDAAQLGVQANPRDPGLPTDEELRSLHFDRLVHCDSCREASATVDRPGGRRLRHHRRTRPAGRRAHPGRPADRAAEPGPPAELQGSPLLRAGPDPAGRVSVVVLRLLPRIAREDLAAGGES
ncbi:hypothetical protein JNW88_16430 [Micromonospora sp. ATA32]|nr:hypothetical protein [Micromonospora sp. ATA32]